MDLQSVTSRVHYVSKVVQESEYAKQHAATVIFYNQYNCKAVCGIRLARVEDPECWPEVTLQSLRRALKNQAPEDFSENAKVDETSPLTKVEREDLPAGTYRDTYQGSGHLFYFV